MGCGVFADGDEYGVAIDFEALDDARLGLGGESSGFADGQGFAIDDGRWGLAEGDAVQFEGGGGRGSAPRGGWLGSGLSCFRLRWGLGA